MCFIFKSLKWSRVLLPTDGWPAYVRWQKLYGRKPRQAGQRLEKLSELPPLLEHSTFPPSSLGRPQLTINSWCTLQNCFISLRNDELQRSVAIVSHSLEDGYSWDFSPMLTLRLRVKTNWLIYKTNILQNYRHRVNCLGQAPQKHMGWKWLISFQYPLVDESNYPSSHWFVPANH